MMNILMNRTITAKFSMAVVAIGICLPSPGSAQNVLEEVIVTATKRAENLQDIPMSVAALRGEKLDILGSGGLDLRFLSARIPSLQIESSFGRSFPRFYIRGLGNTDFDLNSSQPVSLVFDEVILENPVLKGFPVFDLDRIEVLRGPQGTTFGRNTTAGIVKFDSKRPSQESDGYAQVSYGRFNAVNFESAVGGGLSDAVSGRVSVMYQRRDDWVDNLAPGFEEEDALEGFNEFAGRAQLLFEPNDKFTALANIHGRSLSGTARVFRANIATVGGPPDTYTINQTNTGFGSQAGGTIVDFERDVTYNDAPNFQDVDAFGAVLNMEYDFGRVTLTSISAYESVEIFTRGDIDGGTGDNYDFSGPIGPGFIPFRGDTQDNIPDLDQITQEIRLNSNEWGRLDWQLGFFYFHEDVNIETFDFGEQVILGLSNPVAIALQEQETESWAIFGSVDYDVTDQFNLRVGVRYTDEGKDFDASKPLDTRPFFLWFGGPFDPDPVSTQDEVFTWDVSTTYSTSDDTNLYARVASSFRAPSIQGRIAFFPGDTAVTGADIQDSVSIGDTEKIISFEAGFKTTVLDGRGRVNVGGFYYEIKDQQLTAVGGGGNFNTLINADETVGYGFELDMEFEPVENLSITFGASYNFTEIQDDDLTVTGCGSQQCTITDPFVRVPDPTALPVVDGEFVGSLTVVNIDGNRLPQSPRWIANWTLRYAIPVTNGELFAYTDWAYRSRVNFFLYESLEFRDDSLLEGGLRVGYLWDSGKYEIAAFGRNITNDESLTGAIDFNNQTGFVNEPATWGIEFSARLGE